jgi:hypothetical protein
MSQDCCALKKKNKVIVLINKGTDSGDKQSKKSQTLKQAFFLRLNNINLCNFDLSQLIKRLSLIIPCTISKNRLKIKTCTLINTKANSYIFIDRKLAEKVG